jgi:hypothetical protein
MHPNRRFAVLLAAIAALVVLIVWSPWSSSGEDHSKEAMLAEASSLLEENDAPPELTRCFVGALAKNVTDKEVEEAYAALPEGADQSDANVFELSPQLSSKVSRYALICLQRLVRSGKYNPREISEMLRGWSR